MLSRLTLNRVTYWLECGHLQVTIGVEVLLGVVDGHSTIDAVGEGSVLHDGYALVGTIGVLEVHGGGPVVGEIFGEGASCACTLLADITSHVGVESISSNNLMDVGGGSPAGLDEGVETLDC